MKKQNSDFVLRIFRRLNRIFHFVDGGRNLISLTSPPALYGSSQILNFIQKTNPSSESRERTIVNSNPPFLLRDVVVSANSGNVFKQIGDVFYYVVESDYRHPYQALWSAKRPNRKPATQLEGRCVVVAKRSGNYYHFLVEELPDILEELAMQPTRVIVSKDSPKFVFQFLDFFTDYETTDQNYLFVRELIKKPKDLMNLNDFSNRRFENLRSILDKEGRKEKMNVKDVFIRRDPNDHLEGIVAKEFCKFGFEEIWLESLSVAIQASIFSEANRIVGFHGAGMSNIVFCKSSEATLVELSVASISSRHYRRSLAGRCYEPLSKQVGVRYVYFEINDHKSYRDQVQNIIKLIG